MADKSLTIEQILTILAGTPGRLAELTAGLTRTQLQTAPDPAEWSANEVLAHLRACADIWGGCIRTILAEQQPTIRAINPRTWIKRTDYLDLEFQPSLEAFTGQRQELMGVLNTLPAAGWRRLATVTGAGQPLAVTVQDYAQRLARHERTHLRQVAALASTLAR